MSDKPAEAVRAEAGLVAGTSRTGRQRRNAGLLSLQETQVRCLRRPSCTSSCPASTAPRIAIVIPGRRGPTVLIDAGANADGRPEHLVQFAHMGAVFAEGSSTSPTLQSGSLSIGEEAEEGNQLTLETHALLEDADVRFEGNTEGRALLEGDADVVVCDGFTGNVALKTLGERFAVCWARFETKSRRRAGPGSAACSSGPAARSPLASGPRHVRRRIPARAARARR